MTTIVAPLGRAPYPTYTWINSWWGSAPAHWEPTRLRWLCRINPSKSEVAGLPDDTPVSFLPMKSIGEDGALSLDEDRTLGEVREGFTYFRDSDVLVAKITPCFENGKGAFCENLTSGTGFGTTELHVLRATKNLLPRFLFYLTRADAFREVGAAMMQGAAGQQRVPEEFVRNLTVGCPPLPEQQAITAYLDRETARIDTLVAKKERLIALLEEKRAALISQAVTRGLNPTAPVKDSGVPWLGQVPAHWQVLRLRDVARSLQTGPFGSQLHAEEYIANGTPIINPSHLRDGCVVADMDCTVDEQTRLRLLRHELKAGDIVFARRGEMGRCGLVTAKEAGWMCGTGSLRMRLNTDVCYPPYLNRLLSTAGVRDWLLLESVGSTMDNLNTNILGRIPLLLPPLEEQRAIAAYIDQGSSQIACLIAKVRTHIDRLREHRTALISAAVTGQIDVREAAG